MLTALFSGNVIPQVVQSNFQGVLVPKYISSGTATRLPYLFRATVSGLVPNTKYRYYTQACRYVDFGTTNSGAGNPVLINDTNFRYTTSTSLSTPSGYDSLYTNASGNYTGWFGFVHTGNARFTAGNYVYPTLTLDSMGNGVTKYRFALNDSIFVLNFTDSAIVTAGTGIYGITVAAPKKVVTLYDNVGGTGRPLSIVYVESVGFTSTFIGSLVPYYLDSVVTRNGRWGAVIPNILPNGLRRVNVHNLNNGLISNSITDSDGVWTGGINTVNPNGGSANPIRLVINNFPILVHNENIFVKDFSLMQNFPNPFNPVTTIRFSIPENGHTRLMVYDLLGQEIEMLVNNSLNAGTYDVRFDGSGLVSGVYFYSLEFTGPDSKKFSEKRKFVLIK